MESLKRHEIPGHVHIISGQGGLPAIQVESPHGTAEIYLHGAHLTRFRKTGEPPLLFMSRASEFLPDKPIRGGVPLVFPWFGPREGQPMHGVARLADWDLNGAAVLPGGEIRLSLGLSSPAAWDATLLVTVGASLTIELAVTNTGNADFTFENCLHTYFQIGDVREISITGLQGTRYFDTLIPAECVESAAAIRIAGEVDRIYQDTAATVDIHDPVLGRTIHVGKSGSRSTVVWNPWIAKSQRMPDFGDDEYREMVCVESGNVKEHAVTLAPGASHSLRLEVSSTPLASVISP